MNGNFKKMIKVKIINESRGRDSRRKKNPRKLRIRKAKQSAARAERLAIKNASRWKKLMTKLKPYIEKLPRGKTLYLLFNAYEVGASAWKSLSKAAQEIGYGPNEVFQAFLGTKDRGVFWGVHCGYMFRALFRWALDGGILHGIPGYDEGMYVKFLVESIARKMGYELTPDMEVYNYIRDSSSNPDQYNKDGWRDYNSTGERDGTAAWMKRSKNL